MKKILVISSGTMEQSKKWVREKILKQSKDGKGVWGDYYFSCEKSDGPFDGVAKIGRISSDWDIHCNPKNIVAVHMEPYLGATYWHNWMISGNEECSHIISSYMGDKNGDKQIIGHALHPWYLEKNYAELTTMDIPDKLEQNKLSWITSNQMGLPYHRHRMYFKSYVDKYHPELFDISGRGIKSIDSKWAAMAPYKYVLAIENVYEPHIWSEKLADPFLAYSLPFFSGCPNILEYFPEDSFVPIDIKNPEETLEIIKKTIQDKQWEKSLPAIKEARRLVLEQYQFVPYMCKFYDDNYTEGAYEHITINQHKPSFGVWLQERAGSRIRSVYKKYIKLKCKLV